MAVKLQSGDVLDAELDFIQELNYIDDEDANELTPDALDVVDDERSKSPEDDVSWLREAGFSQVADEYEAGEMVDPAAISVEIITLTRKQSEVVIKKINTLNTIRLRQAHHTDVREVFNLQDTADALPSVAGDVCTPVPMARNFDFDFVQKHPKVFKTKGSHLIPSDSTSGVISLSIAPASPSHKTFGNVADPSEDDISFNMVDDKLSQDCSFDAKPGDITNGLPNFQLNADPLGITSVDNIGLTDVKRVRELSLIELTALFDQHNISYSKIKAKRKKNKDSVLFGMPVHMLVERDKKRNEDIEVPFILQQLTKVLEEKGLKEEGILRIPGLQTRVKQIKQELEAYFYTNGAKSVWDNAAASDIATLLKQWLRELPVPLLTCELIQAFSSVQLVKEVKEQVRSLNFLVLMLPKPNRDTLKHLLQFLEKVVQNEKSNKMNINNVAMIMAPNIFIVSQRDKVKPSQAYNELQMAAGTATVIKLMIMYREILWTVPAFMLKQIRYQHTIDFCRKEKYRQKKNKVDFKKPKRAVQENTSVRVLAPPCSSSPKTLNISPTEKSDMTIAGDVVKKLCGSLIKKQVISWSDHALYEVGGNIEERRLEHGASLLHIFKENPTGKWELRCLHPRVFEIEKL